MPMAHAAPTIAVARARPYPFSTSWGIMMPPITAACAEVDPETPAKNVSATTTTCPSPPCRWPTKE